ncbi:hypothetical protein [Breznakia pachnodae]|uniref:N-acetyltransferase domain-containing protein n=1 Tax=Breznakia pachnodae TaxID=265178 RepID=A0ABU0E5E6_9FIRM|nr:hypothetical protein [Breznakia pachnodae]MDQ0362107.1 hypothetical protein [Breznakia pachnodae]
MGLIGFIRKKLGYSTQSEYTSLNTFNDDEELITEDIEEDEKTNDYLRDVEQYDILNAYLSSEVKNIKINPCIGASGSNEYMYELIEYCLDFTRKYLRLKLKLVLKGNQVFYFSPTFSNIERINSSGGKFWINVKTGDHTDTYRFFVYLNEGATLERVEYNSKSMRGRYERTVVVPYYEFLKKVDPLQYQLEKIKESYLMGETNDENIYIRKFTGKDNRKYALFLKYNFGEKSPTIYYIDSNGDTPGMHLEFRYKNEYELNDVPLEADYIEIVDIVLSNRNIGIGSHIMKLCKDIAVEYGFNYIWGSLSMVDEQDTNNKERRNHFYDKHGFQITGTKIKCVLKND